MSNCIICSPSSQFLIVETPYSVAMHFPYAIKKGHIIVGIKSHERLLEDIDTQELLETTKLLKKIATIIKPTVGAERFYVAVVGDKDLHFHYHLLPKLESEPVLGPYIFGIEGWRREVGNKSAVEADQELTNLVRNLIHS